MGLGKTSSLLRLPKREDGHFLGLVGGTAVLCTVFFIFCSTAGEQARFSDDAGVMESNPPFVWRRRSLERASMQATEQSFAATEPGYISSNSRGTLAAAAHERALVLYVYSGADGVHQNNLNYFVQHGISASDGCDYIFVVQGTENSQATKSLPRLPPNAQYFYANDSACEPGLGLAAKVLNSSLVKKEDYAHFFFLSSAFRGPFIPTYALEEQHWTRHFARRLTDKVKLVGPTISCHVPRFPDGLQQMDPVPPHVQFSVLATDKVGLGVLEAAGDVLQCHANPVDAAFHSSLGASAAMLRANYSLDSFMTRYRNVDWSDARTWECNSRKDPLAEFAYDGASIQPYETMFVPMDTIAIENGWSFAKMAALYETWLTLQDRGDLDITTNQWVSDPWPTKLQRIAYAQSRGPGCFDNHYYLQKNADLKVIPTALELWNHFVMMGQFEGRSHRWSCEDDRKLS